MIAAAHQPGARDSVVVGGAEGAVADQGDLSRELVGHGVDVGDIQHFIDSHARQDGGQEARQQGLAIFLLAKYHWKKDNMVMVFQNFQLEYLGVGPVLIGTLGSPKTRSVPGQIPRSFRRSINPTDL